MREKEFRRHGADVKSGVGKGLDVGRGRGGTVRISWWRVGLI